MLIWLLNFVKFFFRIFHHLVYSFHVPLFVTVDALFVISSIKHIVHKNNKAREVIGEQAIVENEIEQPKKGANGKLTSEINM